MTKPSPETTEIRPNLPQRQQRYDQTFPRDNRDMTKPSPQSRSRTGHSNGEIARHLGISPHTAAGWIRRFADSGNTTDKPRCGRPHCTTPDQDLLAIIGAYDGDPFTTTTSILSAYDISCSMQTIRNRLHASGLRGRKLARKPELTERVMEQRMEYALEYSDKDQEFWNNVIFCDEKTFSADEEWVSWVWRTENTRYEKEYFKPTKRSGRISAGLFGWISGAGVGELTDVGEGRFTGEKCVEILDEVLLPSVRALLFPDTMPFTLVQDNSPIHTSRIVKLYFHNHPEITVMPHPPRSPDLNPIEHNIWAVMAKTCAKDVARHNRSAVVRSAQRAWEELRVPDGQELINTITRGIHAQETK
ncbi:hypothetical protein Pcinc_007542 [Petrolisthes cinctipes]|uniref:Transposase n=1 Tax=Petrolisthes cinctipes TaxID=88211 RepID=A0AAE1KXB6_PETCI|nr:hypothetical protein Pcinc_007542 [Petrolisthes cinctipes]